MRPEPGYTRAEVLEGTAAALPRIDMNALTSQTSSNQEQMFKELNADLQVQTKMLGLLGRDNNGLYQGIASRQVLNGRTFNVIGVAGLTYVKNYGIAIHVYRQYESPRTISDLFDISKQLHRDFVAVNEAAR